MGRRARKEQIQARIKALEFAMTSEVLAGIEESLSGMGDLYDIFISYSRRDAEKVAMAKLLKFVAIKCRG